MTPPVQYTITRSEDGATITILGDGETSVIHDTHPLFSQAAGRIKAGATYEEIKHLANVERFANQQIEQLSHDVKITNGKVTYRGDTIDPVLESYVLQTVREGDKDDWRRLVCFTERVMKNPNQNSRVQLFKFLRDHGMVLTNRGFFVAYKGTEAGPEYRSVFKGKGIVDGVLINDGKGIPNRVGSVIEFPRDQVEDDPNVGCAQGLHVGSFENARNWSNGGFLTCAVDPGDVVSVPNYSSFAKVRTSRYYVLDVAPDSKLVKANDYGTAI